DTLSARPVHEVDTVVEVFVLDLAVPTEVSYPVSGLRSHEIMGSERELRSTLGVDGIAPLETELDVDTSEGDARREVLRGSPGVHIRETRLIKDSVPAATLC